MDGISARAILSCRHGALALLLVAVAGPALAVECGEVITGDARLDRDLICTDEVALTVDGSYVPGGVGSPTR